jgi:1-acyl-sn-glycerol-3-phosphate acyltransferase
MMKTDSRLWQILVWLVQRFLMWPFVFMMTRLVNRLEIEGLENLEELNGRSFLLCMNHVSVWDFMCGYIVGYKAIGFSGPSKSLMCGLGTDDHFKGIVGFLSNLGGVIAINRKQGLEQEGMQSLMDLLNNPVMRVGALIYPEGTRSKTGKLLPEFKPGIGYLSCVSDTVVLPVFHFGFKSFPLGRKLVIKIEKPVFPAPDSANKIGEWGRLTNKLHSVMKAMEDSEDPKPPKLIKPGEQENDNEVLDIVAAPDMPCEALAEEELGLPFLVSLDWKQKDQIQEYISQAKNRCCSLTWERWARRKEELLALLDGVEFEHFLVRFEKLEPGLVSFFDRIGDKVKHLTAVPEDLGSILNVESSMSSLVAKDSPMKHVDCIAVNNTGATLLNPHLQIEMLKEFLKNNEFFAGLKVGVLGNIWNKTQIKSWKQLGAEKFYLGDWTAFLPNCGIKDALLEHYSQRNESQFALTPDPLSRFGSKKAWCVNFGTRVASDAEKFYAAMKKLEQGLNPVTKELELIDRLTCGYWKEIREKGLKSELTVAEGIQKVWEDWGNRMRASVNTETPKGFFDRYLPGSPEISRFFKILKKQNKSIDSQSAKDVLDSVLNSDSQ